MALCCTNCGAESDDPLCDTCNKESEKDRRIAELEEQLRKESKQTAHWEFLAHAYRLERDRVRAQVAEKGRIIEVLAGYATNCPPEPVKCRRQTDAVSDTHETCIACRIAWATAKAQENE